MKKLMGPPNIWAMYSMKSARNHFAESQSSEMGAATMDGDDIVLVILVFVLCRGWCCLNNDASGSSNVLFHCFIPLKVHEGVIAFCWCNIEKRVDQQMCTQLQCYRGEGGHRIHQGLAKKNRSDIWGIGGGKWHVYQVPTKLILGV